jgi:3-oxoacyl-[acyl-carrier protein] reductase
MSQGILRLGDLQAVSLQELDLMLEVNVRGVFLAIRAAAHLSEGGRIIQSAATPPFGAAIQGPASTQ